MPAIYMRNQIVQIHIQIASLDSQAKEDDCSINQEPELISQLLAIKRTVKRNTAS